MSKTKTWADLSESAKAYFFGDSEWDQHFSAEVIEEAKEYYAMHLGSQECGRGWAASAAWHYAQGALRFMKHDQP